LLLSGAWNWVIVARSRAPGTGRGAETLRAGDAIAIGVVQGLAVLPGLSRSASTIGMGVALGLTREVAARYSFLLSLPAVAGALFLQAKDIRALPSEDLTAVVIGTFVSFGVGLAALWALFAMLRKGRFDVFAYYCWALGGIVLFLASR
jgi:undecaprenyl-diphosphatase